MTHAKRDNPPTHSAMRHAFTLIELVIASSISTILLLAIISAILLATKALPQSSPAAAMTEAAQAADRVAADLACAKSITSATATSIEFVVPDRDADDVDETIVYSWDATPGSALLRAASGGAKGELVDGVESFAIKLGTVVEGEAPRTTQQSTAEQTVFAATSGTAVVKTLNTSAPLLETFKPSLPAGATSWTMERVDFYLAASGTASASFTVALYELDLTLLPIGSLIVSASINESTLPASPGWVTLPLPRAQGLDPSKQYGFIFTQNNSTSGDAATLYALTIPAATGSASGCLNSKLLLLWLPDTTKRLAMQIRATALVSVTTPDTRRTVVKNVDVSLKLANTLRGVSTGVKLLNEPGAP